MQNLSPHRTFIDPHNTEGIGKVLKHTPIPRRETPLEGTKSMLCLKDPAFLKRITSLSVEEGPPPLAAVVMGALAMICAGMLLILPWIAGPIGRFYDVAQKRWEKAFPGISDHMEGLSDSMSFLLVAGLLAGVHLCGIFSHIESKGGVNMGVWAILGLYAGVFLNLLLLHWFG